MKVICASTSIDSVSKVFSPILIKYPSNCHAIILFPYLSKVLLISVHSLSSLYNSIYAFFCIKCGAIFLLYLIQSYNNKKLLSPFYTWENSEMWSDLSGVLHSGFKLKYTLFLNVLELTSAETSSPHAFLCSLYLDLHPPHSTETILIEVNLQPLTLPKSKKAFQYLTCLLIHGFAYCFALASFTLPFFLLLCPLLTLYAGIICRERAKN